MNFFTARWNYWSLSLIMDFLFYLNLELCASVWWYSWLKMVSSIRICNAPTHMPTASAYLPLSWRKVTLAILATPGCAPPFWCQLWSDSLTLIGLLLRVIRILWTLDHWLLARRKLDPSFNFIAFLHHSVCQVFSREKSFLSCFCSLSHRTWCSLQPL